VIGLANDSFVSRSTFYAMGGKPGRSQLDKHLSMWILEKPYEVGRREAVKEILTCFDRDSSYLVLADMGLTSLPKGMDALTRLTHLDLSGNALTTVPKELRYLPLKNINLRHNHLKKFNSTLKYLYPIADLDHNYRIKLELIWHQTRSALSSVFGEGAISSRDRKQFGRKEGLYSPPHQRTFQLFSANLPQPPVLQPETCHSNSPQLCRDRLQDDSFSSWVMVPSPNHSTPDLPSDQNLFGAHRGNDCLLASAPPWNEEEGLQPSYRENPRPPYGENLLPPPYTETGGPPPYSQLPYNPLPYREDQPPPYSPPPYREDPPPYTETESLPPYAQSLPPYAQSLPPYTENHSEKKLSPSWIPLGMRVFVHKGRRFTQRIMQRISHFFPLPSIVRVFFEKGRRLTQRIIEKIPNPFRSQKHEGLRKRKGERPPYS
jgi:hypothetical protein